MLLRGNKASVVVWLLLAIILIALFGIGTLLEAAFWALLIIAALVVAAFVLVARLVL